MSILSGIAGAGGGFVMTPLAIFLGLAPAQAVAASKFSGLANTVGSLSGLRKYKSSVSKRRIIMIMLLAFVVGLIVPSIIKAFNNRWYQLTLGVILLLLLPVLYFRRIGITPHTPTRSQQAAGGVLLTASLFLQGIFSGGLGALVNVVLMGLLGQTATEAQITKRWSQLILNITVIFGIFGSGLILWPVVGVGVITSLAGSAIGGHLAVKKGDSFAANILIGLMAVSAIVLIIGAL